MDTIEPLRFIFAFVLVLGLIGVMAMALKYFAATGKFTRSLAKPGEGRIEILETRYIDARRRLILIRRDHAQHLLLLADGRETVIESGFTAPHELPHA